MSVFAANKPALAPLTSKLGLIYGPEGGGKSTLVAGAQDAAVIDTEGGHKGFDLDAYVHAATWPEIKEACQFVAAHKTKGVTIVDSLSRAYDVARAHVLTANGWKDERDGGGFGAGFAAVRNEFRSAIDPLFDLPAKGVGVFLVTHTTTETIEKPTGDITIVKPDLADKKSYNAIARMADFILHYAPEQDAEGNQLHVLRSQNDGLFVAKDRTARFPAQFVVPNVTGTPTERAGLVWKAINGVYEGKKNAS